MTLVLQGSLRPKSRYVFNGSLQDFVVHFYLYFTVWISVSARAREYVREKCDNTQYFFPRKRNGEINHITDEQLRMKFKEFMNICGLPKLTVHSFRYIYATKLYLQGVPPDAIQDILGVDKRTLKYYVKATQQRKKKALFTHLEKVSALPKEL